MIDVVEARVHIGATEIPYLRVGRGPAAILLVCSEGEPPPAGGGTSTRSAFDSPLLASLSRTFRVIVPLVSPPVDQNEGERWIQGLIDGLGLDRPTLVVGRRLASLVSGFAGRDPQRVGTVVLLPESEEGEVQISAILPHLLGPTPAV